MDNTFATIVWKKHLNKLSAKRRAANKAARKTRRAQRRRV